MLKRLVHSATSGIRKGSHPSVVHTTDANPLTVYAETNDDGRVMLKWAHYLDAYHRHLARFRGQPVTLIEIGVLRGGSLRMWRDYLGAQATIVGVDIDPECTKFREIGIEIVIGDQGDRTFLQALLARFPAPAILLDDGGHKMHEQLATFEEFYPHLQADGVYICEDLHTSYWKDFGGGLNRTDTFIEKAKSLVDRLNAHHVPENALPPDGFTGSTDSIHFYDSMVVIEKRCRNPPEKKYYWGSAAATSDAPHPARN